MTKDMILEKMVDNLSNQGFPRNSIISKPHFYKIWDKHFKHVIIPKVCTIHPTKICTQGFFRGGGLGLKNLNQCSMSLLEYNSQHP